MKSLEKYNLDSILKHVAQISEKEMEIFCDPEHVVKHAKALLINSRIEKMIVYFLSSRNKLIDQQIFEGTINKAVIYPREIFRQALIKDATGVILAHNHPSGEPEPSGNDIHLTGLISAGLNTLDVKLIDHVIVTPDKYFSFAEENIL